MTLAEAAGSYLSRLWSEPVAVTALARIPGGASRETYRLDVSVGSSAGARTRALILRRDPVGSLLETDRQTEFLAYRTAYAAGLPVPEPIALETGESELERPFFIMERVPGGTAPSPFRPLPFGQHARAIGEQAFGALGRLAALDPAGTALGASQPACSPDTCWRTALDDWEAVLDTDEDEPQPIVRAAIRRLRAAPPPPPAAVRIVHGDFRSGNWLHDGAGQLLAVLDWEMAHLGDPLEDLGWAFDPLWDHREPGRACGTLALAEALATWERASGLVANREALAWWRLFNMVKGRAIWTSAWREYCDGGYLDPVLGVSGWFVARRHDALIAAALADGLADI